MDIHQEAQLEPLRQSLPPPLHLVSQAKQELPLSQLQRMRLQLWSLRHRQQLPVQQRSHTEVARLAKHVRVLVALCCEDIQTVRSSKALLNQLQPHELSLHGTSVMQMKMYCKDMSTGLQGPAGPVCTAAATRKATLLLWEYMFWYFRLTCCQSSQRPDLTWLTLSKASCCLDRCCFSISALAAVASCKPQAMKKIAEQNRELIV